MLCADTGAAASRLRSGSAVVARRGCGVARQGGDGRGEILTVAGGRARAKRRRNASRNRVIISAAFNHADSSTPPCKTKRQTVQRTAAAHPLHRGTGHRALGRTDYRQDWCDRRALRRSREENCAFERDKLHVSPWHPVEMPGRGAHASGTPPDTCAERGAATPGRWPAQAR